jgi:trimethylamine---corrinoid protein Co-methyltransferase
MLKRNNVVQEVLSEADVGKIHQTSLDLLEKVGVRVHSEEALQILKKHGARVENSRVFIAPNMVEENLKRILSTFPVKSRNPKYDIVIGGEEPVCTPSAGPVYVVEKDGKRRRSTSHDAINLIKLTQTSDFLHMNGGAAVVPSDISGEAIFTYVALITALYTDKPLPGFTYGTRVAEESIDIASRILGKESYNLIATINTTSPLIYDKTQLEGLLVYARARQPLCIASCGMAGSTTPTTLAATLAVTNAEILFGIILTQLVSPGTPVIYGNTSSVMDMRHISFSMGAPESSLILVASAQLSRFYGLPFRGGGSLTDSKTTDVQAGYESMLNMSMTYLCGADYVFHAVGILDSLTSFSFDKFIIDEEIGLMMKRFSRGIEVNEDTLAYDLVASTKEGFLSTLHTAKNFRKEFFQPRISNRQHYTEWIKEDTADASKVRENYLQSRLDSYTIPDMEKGLKQELIAYYEGLYGEPKGI